MDFESGCSKSKFPIFSPHHVTVRMLWKLKKYSVWDCGNTEFLVGRSTRTNEKSSTTNMELPIACLSVCVSRTVIQFLTVKNTSVVEIHRKLTEVYGSDIMNQQMARKWCQKFCKGRHEMQDESCTGHPKLGMDEYVNTIRALLNKDLRLTIREPEMIMNDDFGGSTFTNVDISYCDGEVRVSQSVRTMGFHQLSPEHKTNRMAAALIFWRYERDSEEMLSRIVTGIQNCFVRKNKVMCTVFLGSERGHKAGIPSQAHNH